MTATTATAAPPPSVFRRDFPGWLPPMLVKELRQGLRTRGFVGALMIFQIIMLLLMLTSLATQTAQNPLARMSGAGATGAFFWTILSVLLIIVTPARALGGLQLEFESQTLDLLLLTRLNAWRVVLGKWISLLAQAFLLLVAMLPYLVVRYFTDNADIVTDLGICVAMLGVCAVLTAAGLWASGIAKVLRIVAVILLVLGVQGASGMFGLRFFGSRPVLGGGSSIVGLLSSPFDIFNAALITAFFLVSAVRNVAPRAENHCFFVRLLPIFALLPAPFAETIGAHDLAVRQLYFAAAFLAFVLLFELGLARSPMASHWREWRKGGPLTRVAGRCALPGWPSALLYALVAAGAWAIFALIVLPTGTTASRGQAEGVVRIALLAAAAMFFPAVLQALLRGVRASPILIYFSGLAIPMLVTGLAVALAESKWKLVGLRSLMETMPVSSFLFAVSQTGQSEVTASFANMVAVVVLGAAAWLSRPYWRQLVAFEAADRGEPGPV